VLFIVSDGFSGMGGTSPWGVEVEEDEFVDVEDECFGALIDDGLSLFEVEDEGGAE